MALFDTIPTKKKKYFDDEDAPTSRLFSELPTGEEENATQAAIGKNLQGMLSGESYDPYRTKQRETLGRAAQSLRSQTGATIAGAGQLGQGQAAQAQQATEQNIFSTLADTEIGMDVEEQAMKERGIGLATDIGTAQEQSRQFSEELGFRESEAEKDRQNSITLTTMQIEAEKWKTERAESLTKAGWTFEEAQAKLDRDLQTTLTNKQIALQDKIASGQLTQAQAELAQQASQFTSQLDWEKEATKLGIAADNAKMAWQTNERIATEAFAKTESDLDRQLDREIEEGRLTLQEKQIAQTAAQLALQKDELSWKKEATKLGLDDAAAARLWQSSEAALDRVNDANMKQIEMAFAEKGWNYQSLMNNLDNLDEKQAAQLISQSAILAGITYQTTTEDGTQITVPGLKTIPYENVEGIWQPGKILTGNQYDAILGGASTYIEEGTLVDSNDITLEGVASFKRTSSGWQPTEEFKNAISEITGKMIKSKGGELYEFVGYDTKNKMFPPKILFRDIKTGAEKAIYQTGYL